MTRLEELLAPRRLANDHRVVFLVDEFFRGRELLDRLPVREGDRLEFVGTAKEPTTEGIDQIVGGLRSGSNGLPVAIVGIGGGCTLDTAKAVSNLLGNGGRAQDYQGWDLLPGPGIYKIGVPTISGTGAEASRTCVMMNVAKRLKLGMNSQYTIFDALLLDPDLTSTVPREQYFFTGMDTYIHCIESLAGSHRHALADAFSREALRLCADVFGSDTMQSPENLSKLMAASYLGGSALANSYVGIVHPFSAGLSMVLGTHHCVANCIVMNAMDEFYPAEVAEFRNMVSKQSITLPSGLCQALPEEALHDLYLSTIVHEKPLRNALGDGFADVLTEERVIEIFCRM